MTKILCSDRFEPIDNRYVRLFSLESKTTVRRQRHGCLVQKATGILWSKTSRLLRNSLKTLVKSIGPNSTCYSKRPTRLVIVRWFRCAFGFDFIPRTIKTCKLSISVPSNGVVISTCCVSVESVTLSGWFKILN